MRLEDTVAQTTRWGGLKRWSPAILGGVVGLVAMTHGGNAPNNPPGQVVPQLRSPFEANAQLIDITPVTDSPIEALQNNAPGSPGNYRSYNRYVGAALADGTQAIARGDLKEVSNLRTLHFELLALKKPGNLEELLQDAWPKRTTVEGKTLYWIPYSPYHRGYEVFWEPEPNYVAVVTGRYRGALEPPTEEADAVRAYQEYQAACGKEDPKRRAAFAALSGYPNVNLNRQSDLAPKIPNAARATAWWNREPGPADLVDAWAFSSAEEADQHAQKVADMQAKLLAKPVPADLDPFFHGTDRWADGSIYYQFSEGRAYQEARELHLGRIKEKLWGPRK